MGGVFPLEAEPRKLARMSAAGDIPEIRAYPSGVPVLAVWRKQRCPVIFSATNGKSLAW